MTIEQIQTALQQDIKQITTLEELNDLKIKYLGKKGLITTLNQEIKNIPVDQKKAFGAKVNELKNSFQTFYDETKTTLEEAKLIFNGEKRLLNDEFKNKEDIVKRFLIAVINELKTIDNLKISNICLTGGGANILYPTFSKLYPQTILLDDITLQCQGMYKIGEKVFNK